MTQKVFVNRILNMKKIKMIGLDMDHTLIRYHTRNFEALVYKVVVEKLIEQKKYPKEIAKLQFRFEDCIRGLIVDAKNGNILKLSRYGAIRQSAHGTKTIPFNLQQSVHRSTYVDLKDSNYIAIDTSFSIAFCALYSQLIDFKDQNPETLPSYAEITADVLSLVDEAHADGSIKGEIAKNPAAFVIKDAQLVEGLKKFLQHDKRLFILTNSDYAYTKLLLDYAINPFMEAGKGWQDLFEYVITLATKPRFFYDQLKFLAIEPNTGTMKNVTGPLKPGIYQGGSAKQFTKELQINGDEILYIGDHIYGDILRLKKDCNWRTALVVEELGHEIDCQRKALPTEQKIIAAMAEKIAKEAQYTELYTLKLEHPETPMSHSLEDLHQQLHDLDAQISSLLQQQETFYNPLWGRVFRTGAEESYFAYQVERFACIYMEKLTDLLECSPLTYFRAPRRLLPHDLLG